MNQSLKFFTGISILCLLFLTLPILAQSPEVTSCPQIVVTALEATHNACASTSRNEACYGHALVEASIQAGTQTDNFSQSGDMIDLEDLRSLRLSPMAEQQGLWGVSLMRLQANLPDNAPNQNVTLVVFGDVIQENTASEIQQVDVTINSRANLNVRITPRIGATIIAALPTGQTVTANGRLADNAWLRVEVPETGETGWINATGVEPNPALNTLAVVEVGSVYYRPMQAFYFRSGSNDSPCPEAPNSGLLIQTPEGAGKVRFLVNEVSIRLGSTILIQTHPHNEMVISLLEGAATVTYDPITLPMFPGTQVRIPLGADGLPIGPPSSLEPYDMEQVQAAPVSLLEYRFALIHPMTHQEITARMQEMMATLPPFEENLGGLPDLAVDDDNASNNGFGVGGDSSSNTSGSGGGTSGSSAGSTVDVTGETPSDSSSDDVSDDGNRGHGNDPDHYDEDNPGQGKNNN